MTDSSQPETPLFQPVSARVITEDQYLACLSLAGFFRDVMGQANDGTPINPIDIAIHHDLLVVSGEGDDAQLSVEPVAASVIDYLDAMEQAHAAETEVEIRQAQEPEAVPA